MTSVSTLPQRSIGSRAVSAVGLGGARWSLTDAPDEERAARTLFAALDAGVTLIDTARAYTTSTHPAHNEELIARLLTGRGDRDRVLLATKGGHYRDGAGFSIDARPRTLHAHCRESLARLGVEQLDLYLLHWPDPQVPLTESVGALAELREQGLVAMVGVCNVSLDQLTEARRVTRIDAVQNSYSPLRTGDRAVVDECATAGIAYLSYSPLGGPGGARELAGALPAFAAVAERHEVTAHQIAFAWLLARSPVLIPIVGAGRPDSIRAAADAANLTLSPAELAELSIAVRRHGDE